MKIMMVVNLDISGEKGKQKAMKSVSGFAGIDSISWDMKEAQKKLTIIGDIDPVDIVVKLRKHSHTELLLVGPSEEPKKEEPQKKEQPKKDDEPKKKEEPKKDDEPKKKEEPKKDDEPKKKEPKKTYCYDPYGYENPNAAYWRNKGYQ